MKELVQAWMPVAEILGFVGQLVILVILGLGLKQLAIGLKQVQLAERALSVTNERASKERALEFHDLFITRVMPAVVEARQALAHVKGTVTYDGPIGAFTPESISVAAREAAKERYQPSLPALNLLEYYAVGFTSRVADEELGFSLSGRLFCAYVATLYDLIVVIRNDPGFENWKPIVELYRLWASRLTKSELEAQRDKLEVELAGLGPGASLRPIGV